MNPALEQAILSSIEAKKNNGTSFVDKMNDLMGDYEKIQKSQNFEQMFLQNTKNNQSPQMNQDFQQSTFSDFFKKEELIMGIGAGMSGTVADLLSKVIPFNIGLEGLPAVIGGWAGGKFLGKSGMGKDLFTGVRVAGYGIMTMGLTRGIRLGSLGGGSDTDNTDGMSGEEIT